jgi:hypothetical protein
VFVQVEDVKRARRFCDRMASLDWPSILNRLARRVNPLMGTVLLRSGWTADLTPLRDTAVLEPSVARSGFARLS